MTEHMLAAILLRLLTDDGRSYADLDSGVLTVDGYTVLSEEEQAIVEKVIMQ